MNQMAKSLSFKPINNITKNKSIGRQPQCKKHPKHRQNPGVCSLCLAEKLSKVSANSHSRVAIIKARARAYYHSSTASSLSSTSYESSYASSNGGSPLHATGHHRRNFSYVYNHSKEENNNGGFLFFSKSKSLAHVEKESSSVKKLRLLDDKEKMKKEKKNVNGVGKIWSNLLGLRRFNNYQKRVNGSTVVLAS